MKTIDGIVARCADQEELLDELSEDLGETALPNSCDWPAEGAHLSMTTEVWDPRLLACERIPCP